MTGEFALPPQHENPEISVILLSAEVADLRNDVKALTASTEELVEAWKAAKSLVTFVKLLAGLVTAVAAAWLIIRGIVWPHH